MASDLKEFLTTLKDKLNIIEVAGNYLNLDRRGTNYWACCPFHHEKTPSFAINESDQYYHCFGCGESGDVFKLVQNMENVEFMEAVRILADKVNMQIPQTGFDSSKTVEAKRKKDAVLNILNESAHFYLENLNSGRADEHINYILKRNIPSNIVRKFGLGASLNFDGLPKRLIQKGFSVEDMLESGAVSEANGKLIDAQGGRLIFPIINAMDEVIAFGGRVLKKVDFGKYKNTRDTIVFNKRKALYNINLLKKLKKEQTINNIIVVEGYMDTISLYQAGFTNVVASMGTSLTQDQARLLKRYSENILISYDGDAAGQKANMRGLDILCGEGLNVKVVPLTDGLDPDDMIKQLGAGEYQKRLDNAMPLIDYKLKSVEKSFDLSNPYDMRKFVAEAIKLIKTEESASVREELLKRLRDISGITYESLKRDLNSEKAAAPPVKNEVKRKDNSSVFDRASRFVIASFLFGAKYTAEEDITEIPFLNGVHEIIAKYIYSKKLLGERVQAGELLEFFDDDTEEYRELSYVLDYSDGDKLRGEVAEKFFFDCVQKIKLQKTDAAITELKKLIESTGDIAERKALTEKLQALFGERDKIKGGVRK